MRLVRSRPGRRPGGWVMASSNKVSISARVRVMRSLKNTAVPIEPSWRQWNRKAKRSHVRHRYSGTRPRQCCEDFSKPGPLSIETQHYPRIDCGKRIVMKENEVRDRAFAMPLTQPAYPRGP